VVRCHAATRQQRQQAPVSWPLVDLDPSEADALRDAAQEGTSAPILSGAGGGLFFWWELGAWPSSCPARLPSTLLYMEDRI
jgi:hypothetical protein